MFTDCHDHLDDYLNRKIYLSQRSEIAFGKLPSDIEDLRVSFPCFYALELTVGVRSHRLTPSQESLLKLLINPPIPEEDISVFAKLVPESHVTVEGEGNFSRNYPSLGKYRGKSFNSFWVSGKDLEDSGVESEDLRDMLFLFLTIAI
ncbi:hypothetical protein CDAR_227251 [Caerostris darwini]|uniref:Uncharacterized protein n=1 Tax=Caerostris darwini TaxID=1538125 RepID=A0AAV4ULU2_9ARAC|nr:hypothetical protein CDAR_227251 [Caerostris darwini]